MEEKKPNKAQVQEKNKGGRPTLYSEEMQKRADLYLEECTLYKEYNGSLFPNPIPSVAALALILDVDRDTLYNWSKKHTQFFGTLRKIKDKQEMFLIHHGLTKGYDASFAKFLAINVTDFRDKVEQEVTQKEIKVVLPDERSTKL